MQDSSIEWTDHTFNPWSGCTKVSDGCRFCYAEAQEKRYRRTEWGPGKPRRVTSATYWQQPLKWNENAHQNGKQAFVFCASLADVFDLEAPEGAREWLWELIRWTPNLTWLILTKRPENIGDNLPPDWGNGFRNVWLGTSVENQEWADKRIPVLAKVPAVRRFLSLEPLLGPIDQLRLGGIDWVIIGGESGAGARAMSIEWARSILKQCRAAGVAPFLKQLGVKPLHDEAGSLVRLKLQKYKGNDPTEWPEDLSVRERPAPAPARQCDGCGSDELIVMPYDDVLLCRDCVNEAEPMPNASCA